LDETKRLVAADSKRPKAFPKRHLPKLAWTFSGPSFENPFGRRAIVIRPAVLRPVGAEYVGTNDQEEAELPGQTHLCDPQDFPRKDSPEFPKEENFWAKHGATRCNTLQHTATRCNDLAFLTQVLHRDVAPAVKAAATPRGFHRGQACSVRFSAKIRIAPDSSGIGEGGESTKPGISGRFGWWMQVFHTIFRLLSVL
jgi:hypothetical protein